jgi:hypothetical protein
MIHPFFGPKRVLPEIISHNTIFSSGEYLERLGNNLGAYLEAIKALPGEPGRAFGADGIAC